MNSTHKKNYIKQLFYSTYTHNRHQRHTGDGGQAMGEDLRHVQLNT